MIYCYQVRRTHMKGGAEKLKKKTAQPWFDAEENFVFTSF